MRIYDWCWHKHHAHHINLGRGRHVGNIGRLIWYACGARRLYIKSVVRGVVWKCRMWHETSSDTSGYVVS